MGAPQGDPHDAAKTERDTPCGSLAQSVEHEAFNLQVLGSNPRRPNPL